MTPSKEGTLSNQPRVRSSAVDGLDVVLGHAEPYQLAREPLRKASPFHPVLAEVEHHQDGDSPPGPYQIKILFQKGFQHNFCPSDIWAKCVSLRGSNCTRILGQNSSAGTKKRNVILLEDSVDAIIKSCVMS